MEEPLHEEIEFELDEFSVALKGLGKDVTPENLKTALGKIDNEKSLDFCKNYLLEEFGKSSVSVDRFLASMKKTLSPASFVTLELINRRLISHDTVVLRFVLPTEEHISGHKFGDYVIVKKTIDNKDYENKYTPITHPEEKQWFELVIKKKEGKLSNYLFNMKENDVVELKGPFSQYKYTPKEYKRIGIVCCGTGISPFKPLIKELVDDSDDETKITLLYGNKSERDILFYKELKALSKNRKLIFINTISNSVQRSNFIKGHINSCMIQTFLPRPNSGTMVLVCGNKDFNKTVSQILKETGYSNFKVLEA